MVLAVACNRDGFAGIERTRLDAREPGPGLPSIAVGPDGAVHVIYTDGEERLRHSWREPDGDWQDEPVDPRWVSFQRRALAVGADGVLHGVFEAFSGDVLPGGGLESRSVVYGTRDSSGWTLEDTPLAGRHPVLALAPDGGPVVLGKTDTGYTVGRRVEGGWVEEPTGILGKQRWAQADCMVDAGGAVHFLFSRDARLRHATNASGEWTEVLVRDTSASGSMAMDATGTLHVLVPAEGPQGEHAMFHHRNDGSGWTSGMALPDFDAGSDLRLPGELVALGDGRLFAAIADFRYVEGRVFSSHNLVYHDGARWRGTGVLRREAPYLGPAQSLAVGPDGAVHMAGMGYRLVHSRFTLPDLAVAWEEEPSIAAGPVARIFGRVRVENLGPGRSERTRLGLLLSADPARDDGDEAVDFARSIPSLAPGRSRTLRVRARLPEGAAGKHWIAVADPADAAHDLDDANDAAAAPPVE